MYLNRLTVLGAVTGSLGMLLVVASAPALAAGPLPPGAVTGIATQDPLLRLAHYGHAHPYPPYDSYCCHEPTSTVYVVPAYGVGAASVRGVSRRTSRRTSRRVSRRR